MKKVYIVHCWDGKCDDGWYPWLDNELTKKGIEVMRFNMPHTESPVIDEWVSELSKHVNVLDKDTFFIGHSIGCQTIMRYLEKKDVTEIGGILFVAPWLDLLPAALADEESKATAEPWLNTPIDFEKIKKFTSNIRCLFSDNDYFVDVKQRDVFQEKLKVQTFLVHACGHISADDGVYELNDILTLAQEMLGIDYE